jgi:multidrug efflux pump subunit AcrB
MNGAIAWFARNSVASNILMVVVLVIGAFTLTTLRQEVVPTTIIDEVQIRVTYPGATPEEVEEAICMRIEEAVQGLSGVDRLRSQANENFGTVNVEFLESVDRNRFLNEVKSEIDRIDTFPAEAEEPVVNLVEVNNQVLELAIWGDTDRSTLRRAAEKIRAGLQQQDSITQVSLSNAPDLEIAIEVSEETLRQYRLSFAEISAAIARSSLDLPGGNIKTLGGEILVRSKGQAYRPSDFKSIAIRSFADGSRLTLGQIATISDGFEDTDQSAYFNGLPSQSMRLYRVGEQSALTLAEEAHAYIKLAEQELPEGLHLTIYGDESKLLASRIELMLRNGQQGLILVLFALSLFLRLRLALWVTLGIPIAIFGSATLMPGMGVSINLISLMAFITVLGIVVDDAIVVAENIHQKRREGLSGIDAAIQGTQEMSLPVIFAVLTTIATFLPMLFMPGSMGQFASNIPLIVIGCLIFSLVESLLILPSHLRHLPDENTQAKRGLWGTVQDKVNLALDGFIKRVYEPALHVAVRWRYATLAVGIATLVLTASYAKSGRVKFNFFPSIEAENVAVELTMPLGTPMVSTQKAVARFERTARELQAELKNATGEPLILNIATAMGGQPYRERQSSSTGGSAKSFAGGHLGEVTLELASAEDRKLSAVEIAQIWRDRTGQIPGAEEITYNADFLGGDGDIDIRLSGPDLDQLRLAAAELVDDLHSLGGVLSAQDKFREGKKEWKLGISPEGQALGLTLADLALQVRQALHGDEIQSIQRGRDEVDIMLRLPKQDRSSLASFSEMRIRTPSGNQVPFRTVATIESGRGYSTIDRTERRRSLRVTADLDPSMTTPDQITEALQATSFPSLLAKYPDLSIGFEGRQKEQSDFMAAMVKLNLLALLLIYTLLSIPLRSYLQPLIIMAAIPFGIVGAVWGHVFMGIDLAIMSVIGIAALGGVVINDSLVLIDYTNRLRKKGIPIREAIQQAGSRRFRPILLTTLTTFLGLTPLLLEKSLQAQFLIPMAVSLSFGVIFATLITLVLVPSLYLALEDLHDLVGKFAGRKQAAQRSAPARQA